MARAALLRQKPRSRRRNLASPGIIRFSASLALTAPANLAVIHAYEIADIHPGHITIGDAEQGGLLALSDRAAYGLAAADAALFHLHIMESI